MRVPGALVRALAETQSAGLAAWREARGERDSLVFAPALERLLALRREQADALGHGGERYDALLEGYEPGMTCRPAGAGARGAPGGWCRWSGRSPTRPRPELFEGSAWTRTQWRLTLSSSRAWASTWRRAAGPGVHPFTGGMDPHDVRLTTRIVRGNPFSAIFSTIHEGGHGLYEQGFAPGTTAPRSPPRRRWVSTSRSRGSGRTWSGRSLPFWRLLFPPLRSIFPEALGGVELDDFLRAVNRVERSPIRVEADEVTYNLHIGLRFELELGLLRGELRWKTSRRLERRAERASASARRTTPRACSRTSTGPGASSATSRRTPRKPVRGGAVSRRRASAAVALGRDLAARRLPSAARLAPGARAPARASLSAEETVKAAVGSGLDVLARLSPGEVRGAVRSCPAGRPPTG